MYVDAGTNQATHLFWSISWRWGSSGVIGWVEYDVDPFSNELIYSDVFNQEHSLTMLFFLSH